MEINSAKITVETADGQTEKFVTFKDLTMPRTFVEHELKKDLAWHVRDVINFDAHESDVFLAAYSKSGTHWASEIINMLVLGNAEYMKTDKEAMMLDAINTGTVARIPSPRVLNSHYTPRCIPRAIAEKGVKVVHVNRNVKDVLVSLYSHLKQIRFPFTGSFETFFKFFTGAYGVYLYCSWAYYVKEWEYFAKQHPQIVLSLMYEDMKEDPVREVKKINDFLQCNRSDDLVKDIAEACSFANLKKADQDKDHTFKDEEHVNMYRKGEVGDWKNWFTVAQNEQMDQWLEENFTNTDLKIRYTL